MREGQETPVLTPDIPPVPVTSVANLFIVSV